ncbi:phosphate ABC transporter permease PstA [Desulfosoma caldarium]|uniref:Phosphate transport system permease protein PstA n=1 Tax=Desulfosoma caldarium TaxID=610254 RepID=A0A3N1UQM5_9BACT|nr:phosphate ABC transporter permease PstA [Desulfosoma caldarium]ROQ91000.1 phosphate ABC transporter membrane protein 2 (PhoT family) [Desulfosoma caldarium]
MNNRNASSLSATDRSRTVHVVQTGLRKRYRAEKRFQRLGMAAVICALAFLAFLFVDIFSKGYKAFQRTVFLLDVYVDPDVVHVGNLDRADYQSLVKRSLGNLFPDVKGRQEKRELFRLVSGGAGEVVRSKVLEDTSVIGQTIAVWVPADDDVDMAIKGGVDRRLAPSEGRLSERALQWLDALATRGRLAKHWNTAFFTSGDSREPELAGILGATVGSFYTLLVTLALSFPLGVAAAVYLEEFAPKNRWTDIIEVNINNLAAVPSIVFGLLGLAVFLSFFGLPRSSPLVGGLVLTLMTLPTIIIAGRASLQAVPPSIRDAALSVGASPMQAVFHHVLPLALPGMLTGTIIGMARALGETAPLLMVGMVAFIVDIPRGFTDPATVLPVQVYLWADSAERAFVEKTSAAIMVLLAFLIAMNATAVYLRNRFERRW